MATLNTPEVQSFLDSPFCPDPHQLSTKHKNMSDIEQLAIISNTFQMLSHTMFFVSDLAVPSQKVVTRLPPCTWEIVKITHASSQLYSFGPHMADRIRLLVQIDVDVDVYTDQLAYGLFALLNNAFGFLGLYLGIGFIDVILITEKAFSQIWKDHK
jgi:hypothetical protein